MRGGAEILKESGGLITFYPGPCKVGSYLRVGWGGGGGGVEEGQHHCKKSCTFIFDLEDLP